MPIGTAQPTHEQLQAAEHHFIATHKIDQDFNCGAYEVAALDLLDELFKEHENVVAVGGSGLYIKALCEGMDSMPDADPELRTSLKERLKEEGLEALWAELKELDPDYAEVVDRHNHARVLRGLEVCLQSGQPYSEHRRGESSQRNFEIVKIGVNMPREELYDRINRRVDMMIEQGLESEAHALLPHRHLNSLQTVGYRELFDHFLGEISREEAIELIKRNSRRYAKRQITWFRREEDVQWFHPKEINNIISYLEVCK